MNEQVQEFALPERSIYMHEEYEVGYWTRELGCSKEQLAKAVQEAGTGVNAVRRSLSLMQAH